MLSILNIFKSWRDDEKTNKWLFSFAVISLLLSVIVLYTWLIPNYDEVISSIDPVEYNTYKCSGEGPESKTFSIYALSFYSAKKLADTLCQDPRVSKRVGQVKVQWRHQNITNLSVLQDHKYDLLIAHSRHIERAEIQGITGYRFLANYEAYTSYLIATEGKNIELTSKYFTGKRIGLRDSPLSQSGRILPLQAIREAAIEKELVEIIYFKSHYQLRKALMADKVDIIGSYWSDRDSNRYGDLPRIKLGLVEPSKWYYLPTNQDVICAITDALTKLKNSEKGYFSRLSIKQDCTEGKL